ncbi:hypothetical protein QUW15_12940, partial [Desulfovibrio piger]|nr:hypothetical protein [Desulfovibrio piger]
RENTGLVASTFQGPCVICILYLAKINRKNYHRYALKHFQFKTLRISNHTACRFAEKPRFFLSLRADGAGTRSLRRIFRHFMPILAYYPVFYYGFILRFPHMRLLRPNLNINPQQSVRIP